MEPDIPEEHREAARSAWKEAARSLAEGGSSCPGCVLSGSAFTFIPGNSYTITLVTSRNSQFTFTIVR